MVVVVVFVVVVVVVVVVVATAKYKMYTHLVKNLTVESNLAVRSWP